MSSMRIVMAGLSASLRLFQRTFVVFGSILFLAQFAFASKNAKTGVAPNVRCEQIAVGAPIEGQVDSDGENLKLSNSRKWPSSFQSDEVDVIKSLAMLKLDSAQAMISNLDSLLNRSLDHDFRNKYREVRETLGENNPNFSEQDLEAILRFEITRAQASTELEREEERVEQVEARQGEEATVNANPSLLMLVETRRVDPYIPKLEYFDGSKTQMLSDGRLLLSSGRKNLIFNPQTNVTKKLPDGELARVAPDGQSVVILRSDKHSRLHWRLLIYDLSSSVIKSRKIRADAQSEKWNIFDFNGMDISPSGEKLAVSLAGERILILEIQSGKVLKIVDENSEPVNAEFFDKVFFTDEESIVFVNMKRIIRHDFSTGAQSSVQNVLPHSMNKGSMLTPDRRTLVIAKYAAFHSVSTGSLLPLSDSKIPYAKNAWTKILKSLPDDSQHYVAAINEYSGGPQESGIYKMDHSQVFDFNGRYLDRRRVHDIVVGPRNRLVYVFFSNLRPNGASRDDISMDIWRVPED